MDDLSLVARLRDDLPTADLTGPQRHLAAEIAAAVAAPGAPGAPAGPARSGRRYRRPLVVADTVVDDQLQAKIRNGKLVFGNPGTQGLELGGPLAPDQPGGTTDLSGSFVKPASQPAPSSLPPSVQLSAAASTAALRAVIAACETTGEDRRPKASASLAVVLIGDRRGLPREGVLPVIQDGSRYRPE
jgi:hypothetical protein